MYKYLLDMNMNEYLNRYFHMYESELEFKFFP